MSFSSPRIALVYDWVTTNHGGAEQVLLALHQVYPNAPLFTSVWNENQAQWSQSWQVRPSFLQKLPAAGRYYRLLAPGMPLAFEQFDLSEFDVVISISSTFSKGVLTQPQQLHINYLLTPPRFLYSHPDEYLTQASIFKPIVKYLQSWDLLAMNRPDVIIPISGLIQERVKKFYGLTTHKPLYPPVRSLPATKTVAPYPAPYYLVVSRLVKYKQVELAIKACQKLRRNLVIVGDGPEKPNLETLIAQSSPELMITCINSVSDSRLAQLYEHATAVIQPNVEDFGIAVLEGQQLGTPSILNRRSGAAELVSSKQAVFMDDSNLSQLIAAIIRLEKSTFSSQSLINNMKKYDTNNFMRLFEAEVDQLWVNHQNSI